MELHTLKIAKGSRHLPKRVGLGLGSGMGKTSTRGQKGQGARQGRKVPVGFEGGQLPLYRRIPKHGFVSPNRIAYYPINVEDLEKVFADGAEINNTSLLFADIIHNLNQPVKILAKGKVTKKFSVSAQAFSKAAKDAIEKAGGKTTIVSLKDARVAYRQSLEAIAAKGNKGAEDK
jgi:large subunit ribosomal protein L15